MKADCTAAYSKTESQEDCLDYADGVFPDREDISKFGAVDLTGMSKVASKFKPQGRW